MATSLKDHWHSLAHICEARIAWVPKFLERVQDFMLFKIRHVFIYPSCNRLEVMAAEMGWGMERVFLLISTKIDGIEAVDVQRSRLDALDALDARRSRRSHHATRRVICPATTTGVPGVCLERADSALANSLKDLGNFTEIHWHSLAHIYEARIAWVPKFLERVQNFMLFKIHHVFIYPSCNRLEVMGGERGWGVEGVFFFNFDKNFACFT